MFRKLTKAFNAKRPAKSSRGFTLTEVLVASALLLAAIVPILKALTNAHSMGVDIERKTMSLSLAQAKLDDIRARSIYNYSSSFRDDSYNITGSYCGKVTDTAVNSNLRKISVSVGYEVRGNDRLDDDEILISIETLLAKRL